ncbi:LuxR C-terminal-related transcriptional regulator [Streptomyces sp. LNU-CPARS28]|uniref:LuxR C-terminal-related transcriptional regulator n=1 Tax=Streptomyces sp. LNU-CPARS28 TaxID=3137371 RepID=UPI00313504FE
MSGEQRPGSTEDPAPTTAPPDPPPSPDPNAPHTPHDPDTLCPPGAALYARALCAGRVHIREAEPTPCLVDFGLLHPDVDDMQWLLPSEPTSALLGLLRGIEEQVGQERQREAELMAALEPLLTRVPAAPDIPTDIPAQPGSPTGAPARPDGPTDTTPGPEAPTDTTPGPEAPTDTAPGPEGPTDTPPHPARPASPARPTSPALTLHTSLPRISHAIDAAVSRCAEEVLTIQPGGFRPIADLGAAPPREQALLSRGCRMRTLYQHTTRHAFPVIAHFERLDGDVEVRTLSEVTDQLVVFDRAVAFVPADRDSTGALEIRAPAVVGYLVALFERLWRLATPMFPHPAAPQPAKDGVTARQRTIAELLVEGLTDAEIADRLGMNVRTVRVHIAKLTGTLGSRNRTQLGFLISRSGILRPGHPA